MKRVVDTIGNTPLVELAYPANEKVRILAKLEGHNPAGSVKDRPAFNMINEAVKRGELKAGDTIIEATSGNTGIALAMVGQLFDLNVILVMPDSATEERKQTMRAYGAKLIETPAEKTIEYSRIFAEELAEKEGYVILNQFANDDNWMAHFKTTGPEIWKDTEQKITHFVSAMGTTGTIMGVSKYLKQQNTDITIVGAQPEEGSRIPGIRRWSPELLPKFFDPTFVDRTENLSRADAMQGARDLGQNEGIFCGISAGGAYAIAQRIAAEIEEGVIVFIVCDRGDRYLSTELFA